MAVQPKMTLGDPITGFGGSSLRQAYAIFNEHTHGRVAGSCYNWGLRVGMFVEGVLPNNTSVFAPNTRIKEVGPDYFLVDTLLQTPAENLMITGVITFQNPHRVVNATVEGCQIDTARQRVIVPPVGGEVPANLARASELRLVTGMAHLRETNQDVVTTILSTPHSSEFQIGDDHFSIDDLNANFSVSTPLEYTAVIPVLVNPPCPLAIYELTGMLTFPRVLSLPDLRVKAFLRKNAVEILPGHCVFILNGLDVTSTYQYRYTANSNITVQRGDILYLIAEMPDENPIPAGLYLHYTVSFLSLDEPL